MTPAATGAPNLRNLWSPTAQTTANDHKLTGPATNATTLRNTPANLWSPTAQTAAHDHKFAGLERASGAIA